MPALITLDELDFQLRLDLARDAQGVINDARKDHFEALAERASGIVLKHVKRLDDPWDADDAPSNVKAATLIVARNLWDEEEEPLSDPVRNLLVGYRDPTLA